MSGDDIDIVERLCRLWDWLAGSGTAADELLDAADEIVRLLAEVKRLRAAGDAMAATWPEEDRCNCNNSDCRAVVAAFDAWEEARRG